MKRPVDPRQNGKEPKEVHTKTVLKTIGNELMLGDLTEVYNDILTFHSQKNHRLTYGPVFVSSYDILIKYTYEWDNPTYLIEKAQWDKAIADYEIELAAWNKMREEAKKMPESIEQKIARTEQRLANLKAVKAGTFLLKIVK